MDTEDLKLLVMHDLEHSDITILRCVENNIEVPKEWVEYRDNLRHILHQIDDITHVDLPTVPPKPIYPIGTWKFEKYDT